MKRIVGTLLLLFPLVVLAQGMRGMQGMNEQQVQQMMQAMQQVQRCMQGIDQAKMELFQQRATQMDLEVKALCAGGKRDEAMAVAMEFSREVVKSAEMQKMRKCGEIMLGAMPIMPYNPPLDMDKNSKSHICD